MPPIRRDPLNAAFLAHPAVKRAVDALENYAATEWHRILGSTGYPQGKLQASGDRHPGPVDIGNVQSDHDLVSRVLGDAKLARVLVINRYPTQGAYAHGGNAYHRVLRFPAFQFLVEGLGLEDDELEMMLMERERRIIEAVRRGVGRRG